MPRYYFHLHGDDDDEGMELPNDAAARNQARETCGMLIREGDLPARTEMKVVDEAGRRVALLKFSTDP
jgi:hypothetical protein